MGFRGGGVTEMQTQGSSAAIPTRLWNVSTLAAGWECWHVSSERNVCAFLSLITRVETFIINVCFVFERFDFGSIFRSFHLTDISCWG